MNFDQPVEMGRTLSVMPTYRCTASCTHCGTYSTPRDSTFLPVESMLKAIDEAAECGYQVVVFTGGEATLAMEVLLQGLQRASARGLITRLVTNAWWADTNEGAVRIMESLTQAGLREINFSTGDQHARFVPVANVFRACTAAASSGLDPICVMVETTSQSVITKEWLIARDEHVSFRGLYPATSLRLLESPWMPLSPVHTTEYPPSMLLNADTLKSRGGCSSCTKTTTLQADGRLAACCGLGMRSIPELQVGNVRDTSIAEADRRMSEDLLKRWIHLEGPERILAWAATHDTGIIWENMYAHACQACMRLYKDVRVRQVIMEHHEEKLADILMGEFLMYHYRPDGS